MKRVFKKHQQALFGSVVDRLNQSKKVILNATCGAGKTFISWELIRRYVDERKRILVFTYAQNDIRTQWYDEAINKHRIMYPSEVSVVCAAEDVEDFGSCGVSLSNVKKNVPVVITIPQTIKGKAKKLGKFDLIIIDEAHSYLDTNNGDGTLKAIIKECSTKKTKVLGLTATAFDLISKNGFFSDIEDDDCVIYDVDQAMRDGVITHDTIHIEKFNFDIDDKYYNKRGDLTTTGAKFVRSKVHSSKKVEDVLSRLKGKTLIITLPMQDQEICDNINLKFGNGACVLNTMKSKDHRKAEKSFRSDPRVKFMVVVQKCNVGWDYHELENVVDLTFTKSHHLIIQRMLRPCRTSKLIPGKKMGNYYYCCDQSHDEVIAKKRIGQAIWLATKDGIMSYRKNPYEDMSDLFPERLDENKESSSGGHKISVYDWLVDYNINFTRRVIDTIVLTGFESYKKEVERLIGLLPKEDIENKRRRFGYALTISQRGGVGDIELLKSNLVKYDIIKEE